MSQAHKLDCESAAVESRFRAQSDDETEAIEQTKNPTQGVHGQNYSDHDYWDERIEVV